MARIRTIKPDFWTDEKLTECSLSARLLFIGTLNFADDAGNLDRSAKQIKARVFPIDAINCEPLLQELIAQGLLIEYSVNGKKYLHIKNFDRHQIINRPSKPTCPDFHESLITSLPLIDDSLSPHAGREGKGREGIDTLSGKPDESSPENPKPQRRKSHRAESSEILAYLNEKVGSNFRAVESNTKLIEARIDEGATIEELKRVIDTKTAEWKKDPKMAEYLRPSTLFNQTKYAQYAGQISIAAKPAARGLVC